MFYFFKKRIISKTDKDLLQKAINGNAQAYGMLYERYIEEIYRFFYFRVNTIPEAQDLTQETFYKAYDKLKTYKSGSFKAWLYTIARNTVIDYWRKKGKRKKIGFSEFTALYNSTDLVDQIDTKDNVKRLKKALLQLKPNYRQVLELRFISDFSIQETAKILNKSKEWVRVNTHRAIKQLKQHFKIE